MPVCLNCGALLNSHGRRYCTNQCQGDYSYKVYIENWKNGTANGSRGINTRNISAHLVRYLCEKYKTCVMCGWGKIHPVTGKVPLEIDHIDGNSDNNTEQNLRLICSNCHALSHNYRNLNKGHGRAWRRDKYIRSIS